MDDDSREVLPPTPILQLPQRYHRLTQGCPAESSRGGAARPGHCPGCAVASACGPAPCIIVHALDCRLGLLLTTRQHLSQPPNHTQPTTPIPPSSKQQRCVCAALMCGATLLPSSTWSTCLPSTPSPCLGAVTCCCPRSALRNACWPSVRFARWWRLGRVALLLQG